MKWMRAAIATLLLAPGLLAAEAENFLDQPGTAKYALILVGAAVDEERASQFGGWALSLRESLLEDYGYSADHLTLLVGDAAEDDFNFDGACRADSIRAAVDSLAGRIEPGDQLTIFLFGHGSGSGDMAKFNIVGPDLTGSQFGELLKGIETQNLVVVNTTSASRDFSAALSANGRVIVSATRSAAERYDTVFPGYFVEAVREHAADRDKNQRLSILEAFSYAKTRVAAYFRENNMLRSEHATLDDNGDGVFSVAPDQRGDGRLAEIAYLDVPAVASGKLPPAAARLRQRMSGLERDIFLLRSQKSTLTEAEYWAQLEPLLIELAKATREFNGIPQP